MLIGRTLLQQLLTGVAIFVVSLVLLTILQMLLAGNVATGLGYIRSLYLMFLTTGVLWIALAVYVRLFV
jgi:hypothetical protein